MACCSCSPSASGAPLSPAEAPVTDPRAGEWLRLVLAGLVAGQSMIFGLAINLAPPEGTARWVVHGLLALSALVVFFLVGLPIWQRSWTAMLHRRIVMEQLFLAGIAGAFFASVHCTLTGTGHVYYEVVAILLAIYKFGQILGEERRQAAVDAARALGLEFARAERIARANTTPNTTPLPSPEIIPIEQIQPGDLVRVRAGEAIPVDGIVRQGTAFVREAALTGEVFPVVKRPGDEIRAGGHTLDQALEIESTVQGHGRVLDRLLADVRRAQQDKSHLQSEADRLVAWFLPSVLLISLATFAFWTWHSSWTTGLFNALAVLVVACPCSMGLATPVGIWAALSSLASRGLIARKSDLVEALARVDTVVFDKTGTLGEEQLELVDFVSLNAADREELLDQVASLQAHSQHPIAQGFRRAHVAPAKNLRLLPGIGLTGEVSGQLLEIGNAHLDPDSPLKNELRSLLRAETSGSHEVWIRRQGQLVGLGLLRERLRTSSTAALQSLHALGLNCLVLTGDRAEAAQFHQLPGVEAGLSPADKADRIRALEKSGHRVLFVGDGVNDAPAMAEASTSLVMGHGSALAEETAWGQLTGNDLSSVPAAIVRCRAVLRSIRFNLAFAATYNVVGISLAAIGILHPVAAALLMLTSSLTVTWQALRGVQDDPSPRPAPLTRPASHLIRFPRWATALLTLALFLQGPLVVYLGGFSGPTATGFYLLFALAALLLGGFFWHRPLTNQAAMAGTMFSLGGSLMLIGWWADAGFAAVVRDGVCLCGCAQSDMGWGLLLPWNWMSAGMLLAALPTWFLEIPSPQKTPDPSHTANPALPSRWSCWLIGVLGMFLGMEIGAFAMAWIPVQQAGLHFFATYGIMVLGMSLGMLLACELWQRHVAARPAPACSSIRP